MDFRPARGAGRTQKVNTGEASVGRDKKVC